MKPDQTLIETNESDEFNGADSLPSTQLPETDRRSLSLETMQVTLQNLFHLEPVRDRTASMSINQTLNRILSAVWFLLSAIGATPLSLRTLALFADNYLRELCWSFGFQEPITQALYISLVITSGSAGMFVIGVIVFLAFSCIAGVCGFISLLGGLLWGISVGGAGGTAVMGASVVAPTFLLSILGAGVIGLVGTVSKRPAHRRLGPPPAPRDPRESRGRQRRPLPSLPAPSSAAKQLPGTSAVMAAPAVSRPLAARRPPAHPDMEPSARGRDPFPSESSGPAPNPRGMRASAKHGPARQAEHHRPAEVAAPGSTGAAAGGAEAAAPSLQARAGVAGEEKARESLPDHRRQGPRDPAAAAAKAAAAAAKAILNAVAPGAAAAPVASPGFGPALRRGRA